MAEFFVVQTVLGDVFLQRISVLWLIPSINLWMHIAPCVYSLAEYVIHKRDKNSDLAKNAVFSSVCNKMLNIVT
ncbi:hypothetical protein DDN10_07445 [Vibrio cholerae]|nr:hypothetical protein [Vibrio cholerae]EGR4201586.1 hypothetical protein [Vibrio cholerae]EGR4346018.1 hypothetical protein [Vibrio cholerae]